MTELSEISYIMLKNKYVKAGEAKLKLGVSDTTLRRWANEDKIDYVKSDNGTRFYDIDKYIKDRAIIQNVEPEVVKTLKYKKKICYCRVSSHHQKDDLNRQVEFMMEKYPDHDMMTDIGSGLNYKRKRFLMMIDMAINGELEEIVIAHKDRLCRFGFELVEYIFNKLSNCKIVILDNEKMSPDKELTNDLLSIITVFGSRVNGLRKYKKKLVSE